MSDGGGSSSPDRQERVQIALDEVSLFEHTGRILNDHYTKKEYIQRRLGFLDKHPNYRCLPKLLPKVNQEADEVFCDQEEEISVQQVRQRELDCEVDPLLPLPTTANTETLDDFQSYGDTERRPGQQPSQPAVSKPTVKRPGAFSALPPTNLAETRQTRSMVKKAVGSLRQAPSSTLSEVESVDIVEIQASSGGCICRRCVNDLSVKPPPAGEEDEIRTLAPFTCNFPQTTAHDRTYPRRASVCSAVLDDHSATCARAHARSESTPCRRSYLSMPSTLLTVWAFLFFRTDQETSEYNQVPDATPASEVSMLTDGFIHKSSTEKQKKRRPMGGNVPETVMNKDTNLSATTKPQMGPVRKSLRLSNMFHPSPTSAFPSNETGPEVKGKRRSALTAKVKKTRKGNIEK